MTADPSFRELIGRVRRGDGEAAAALVRRYEPHLRRVVRIRLGDRRLRRHLDPQDVCQSVLASFFVRAALGQYELDTPEQLLRLLAAMARNKVVDQARKRHAECQQTQSIESAGGAVGGLAAPGPSPSQQAAWRELAQKARDSLSGKERRLADLRVQDRPWAEIATELRESPDALRMQLARAVSRVTQLLGLDGGCHE
jgi:RNA polymerase sigma-70 factor (ECF subfamily)